MNTIVALAILSIVIAAGASAGSAQTAAELVERAAAASAEGRTDEALRDLNAAIGLDPKYAPAFARRGLLHAQAMLKEQRPGAYDPDTKIPRTEAASSALRDLDRAIELDPRDAYSLMYRGEVKYLLNEIPNALEDYKRAMVLKPDEARFKARYDNGRSRLATLHQAAANARVTAAKRESEPSARRKLLLEALVMNTKAVELHPEEGETYSSRAYTHEELGDHAAEAADLAEYIRLKPDNYLSYYRRGLALERSKRHVEAATEHQRGLAVLEKRGGSVELPLEDFRREIARNLALAGKFDDAFGMFDLALSASRPSYITYHERGKAYLLKGDAAKAEADFRKAVELGRGYTPSADELRKMGKTP